MNQPALGKKIVELRKAKGYTQEELVNKCKLNIRTLQRIESGEVEPRNYTIKAIFTALDYQDETGDASVEIINPVRPTMDKISIFTGRMCGYVTDLFNLKTRKMKKLTILTTLVLCIVFVGTTLMRAQKAENTNQLIGTWVMCNAHGESMYSISNTAEIKVITPETFTVMAVNKENKTLMAELMGTYTLDKAIYAETVTHANPRMLDDAGTVNIFKIIFKGDLLILQGQNNTYYQTWKRVSPEDLKLATAEKK
jgi:transcriptional regulator with XRE-family HTH domain